MQHNDERQCTFTADSANGVHKIEIKAWQGRERSAIMLRHLAGRHWCAAGGAWLEDREFAVRFSTNLDALVYCQVLGLRGVVVAFDDCGRMIYELNVDRILDDLSSDPRIRFVASQSELGRIILRNAADDSSPSA